MKLHSFVTSFPIFCRSRSNCFVTSSFRSGVEGNEEEEEVLLGPDGGVVGGAPLPDPGLLIKRSKNSIVFLNEY